MATRLTLLRHRILLGLLLSLAMAGRLWAGPAETYAEGNGPLVSLPFATELTAPSAFLNAGVTYNRQVFDLTGTFPPLPPHQGGPSYLLTLPAGSGAEAVNAGLPVGWSQRDPRGALNWAQVLPSGMDADRADTLAQLLAGWNQPSPDTTFTGTTAVPEPSTVALVIVGGAGLLALRQRR